MSNLLTLAPVAELRLTANPSPAVAADSSIAIRSSPTSALNRDLQMSELGQVASSVNQLRQAAAGVATSADAADADAPLVSLPALPPMPAPAKAAATTPDDGAKSNVVFTDSDQDAAFIH